MAKTVKHSDKPGRPKVVRTNTIVPIKIDNIQAIANDYVDMETLRENVAQADILTPLEFLVSVYSSDDVDMKLRVDAAKSASKFIHKAKPVAVEHTGADGKDLQIINIQDNARKMLEEFLTVQDAIEGEIVNDNEDE